MENWLHKTGGHLFQVPTWRLSSWQIRYCCFHTFRKLEVEIQIKWNVYFTLHGSLLYCPPLKPCVFVLRCYFKFFLSSKFWKKIFPGITIAFFLRLNSLRLIFKGHDSSISYEYNFCISHWTHLISNVKSPQVHGHLISLGKSRYNYW